VVTLGGLYFMKIAILIDGGYVRALAKQANKLYNPDFIEKVAHSCVDKDEELLRILYYDCSPFSGEVKLPVSGTKKALNKPDDWLNLLAKKDLFAVRRGILKFRGWQPKKQPVARQIPTDEDYVPNFEQKGVDMRIGLDVATFSQNRSVERLALVTNDTDFVPAMKFARKAGLQIVLVSFPEKPCAAELLYHSDISRPVVWPES
jgi:uncharacterized LabA/DUF88 family protein